MKNRIFQIVVILLVGVILVGCSGGQEKSTGSSTSDVCDLTTYKMSAMPVMDKFSGIIQLMDIRDEGSRSTTIDKLKALQGEARNVKCKESYPLKQETLEYTIKHWLDAMNYAELGDFQEATYSLEKAELNFNAFNDWTMDVGN